MAQQAETKQRFWTYLLVPAAAMVLYIGATNLYWLSVGRDDSVKEKTVLETHLTDADMPAVATLVAAMWQGTPTARLEVPETLKQTNHGIYAGARHRGKLTGHGWRTSGTQFEGLRDAISAARNRTTGSLRPSIDTIEFCVAHSYRDVRVGGKRKLGDKHLGVRGLYLRMNEFRERKSPIEMIGENADFEDVVRDFKKRHKLVDDDLTQNTTAETFECDQVLVFLGDKPRAVRMFRGNTVIPQKDVNKASVETLAVSLEDWLARQVRPDGRMTYRYFPAKSKEDTGNNMIRQWMATIALNSTAHRRRDASMFDLAERNIRYNLSKFYREENGLGLIEYRGQSKLGAIALATLAIVTHPNRAAFATYEQAMLRTIDYLHQDTGEFHTFYKPKTRIGQNQNFYPGETQLLWAHLYRENRDPKLLAKFMKSFEYYETWHLEGYDKKGKPNRNPAFVPWHTQAYYMVWELTKDEGLRDFVFEMNDWLLSMQQWESAPYPDVKGRFYDPRRRKFGVPHASSTGVYLEGLIDAFEMARKLGDKEREEKYRLAIARGLRSVMQLQFQDEIDMFYVQRRDSVRGGVRTTVVRDEIRVDNVQHNLLGIHKIMERFSAGDYERAE